MYKIISLGYDCQVKMTFCKDQETHFFDYLGSSMWSINDLLKNNFEDVLDISLFENIEIMNGKKIITNKKYYLRFLHDFNFFKQIGKVKKIPFKMSEDLIKIFKDKYTRRINRFIDLLNGNQQIIFIRIEESKDRILYHSKENEIYYIREFMEIMKSNYPNLNFKLIFISFTEEAIEEEHLLIINADFKDISSYETIITNFINK